MSGRDDLDDVRDLHDVEKRSDARQHVLAGCSRGRDDDIIVGSERHDERRELLRKAVRELRRVGYEHLGDAAELGSSFRRGLAILTGDQHMHIATDGLGSRERLGSCSAKGAVRMFGYEQNGHQITPASVFRRRTSSATSATFTPPLRAAGSAVFSTLSRGAVSTPRS